MKPLRHIITLLLLAALAATYSCSTQKSIVKEREGDYASMTLAERFNALAQSQKEWEKLQFPIKTALLKPEKFSLSGRAYMLRGEYLHFSMRFLGMEVATLHIDGDSITFVDKYHKKYFAESTKNVFAGAQISVSDIQDILLGRVFAGKDGRLTEKSLKNVTLKDSGKDWTVAPKSKIHGVAYHFVIDTDANILTALEATHRKHVYKAVYANSFESEKHGIFNQEINFSLPLAKKTAEVKITSNIKSAKWDYSNKFQTPDLTGYEQMKLEDLVKLFK